ncbi:hypothetical protein [Paenibacillus polymyxa]|uniref:hypothetical protein n=1 Tax=Paenibacillus polymyxa TaxID=1406 RepID=UPI001F3EEBCB|nr:hypothetical protein [Paenibacillus polymyxa]
MGKPGSIYARIGARRDRGFCHWRAEDRDEAKECLAISTRMDVLPSGNVTPCKFFPEMAVATLVMWM